MSRFNLGIIITFLIVLLLIIGNGGHNLINYINESSESEFSNETLLVQQLPESLPTTRSLEQPLASQNVDHQPTPESYDTDEKKSSVGQKDIFDLIPNQPSIKVTGSKDSTSGNDFSIISCFFIMSMTCVNEAPGRRTGINNKSPSSKGGINSLFILERGK